MEWRIERCSENPTLVFAAEELVKYIQKINPAIEAAILKSDNTRQLKNTLKLYVENSKNDFPFIKNPSLDDAYNINIKNGTGIIAGSNARSVLLGVYRFLHALGCRWLRAGSDGEIIPKKDISNCDVNISDTASYRHRGVCIEGCCSFTHVQNMIEWLPKVGMNGYFNQFSTPFCFFDYWYHHKNNSNMEVQPTSIDEITAMVETLTEQIKKRGLLYHATGHGWTCDTIGIPGNSWEKKEFNISDDQREMLAMVNGKREVFQGIALNTNLCYSNAKARDKIITAITDYCRIRREVDYLHFWLADESNNQCECDNCKDILPSDFYVKMLNEIDKQLTAENIPTKIVFLVYFDLLWEPKTERLYNQDRFTLMFAPITRTYTKTFSGDNSGSSVDLAPYVRNKLKMPASVEENIARLKRWQNQFTGDSFDFDYHLIWDQYHDPGGYESARILFEDMKNLDKLNLNGMVSCQVQRVFYPTGLAMNAMAAALWNKNRSFETFALEYFTDMFGEYAPEMHQYFKELSRLFQPAYMRGEKEYVNEESVKLFSEIPMLINKMMPRLLSRMERETDPYRKKTWFALTIHAQICIYLADALILKAKGLQAAAESKWERMVDYVNRIEPLIHDLFDVMYFKNVLGYTIQGTRRFG